MDFLCYLIYEKTVEELLAEEEAEVGGTETAKDGIKVDVETASEETSVKNRFHRSVERRLRKGKRRVRG